ncbi:MAG TPA: FAD-dependent oxidoreductase [Methylomirabilota bacterium]
MNYDVAVVGGGAAGLAAAVAAAGRGARTALVERYGFLGGMATAAMVSTICGLYRTSVSELREPLNEGFAETFARRLTATPGCGKPVRRGRTYVLPYTPFAFACLADEFASSRRIWTCTSTPTSWASRPRTAASRRCASPPGSGSSS